MSRTLEITLLSAEDLRVDRRPVRKNAFAAVKINPYKVYKSKPDESGGSYPTWNEKFEMTMKEEEHCQFLFVEVFYRTGSGRDKKIGDAKIPVTDFMGKYAPEGHLSFLSYRLWDEWGDRNGIVNLSVKVKSESRFRGCQRSSENKTQAKVDYGACASQATGFWRPVEANHQTRMPVGALPAVGLGGRTVTGIPIWCAFQPPKY